MQSVLLDVVRWNQFLINLQKDVLDLDPESIICFGMAVICLGESVIY